MNPVRSTRCGIEKKRQKEEGREKAKTETTDGHGFGKGRRGGAKRVQVEGFRFGKRKVEEEENDFFAPPSVANT